jgi:hypothetical protein
VAWVLEWTYLRWSKQNTQWNTSHLRLKRISKLLRVSSCFPDANDYLNRTNNPETVVYCQDSSALLKHAVAVMNNEDPPPLLSKDGQSLCPPMPKKTDQIDFIFGGRKFRFPWLIRVERSICQDRLVNLSARQTIQRCGICQWSVHYL